jgi:hypothetical protein
LYDTTRTLQVSVTGASGKTLELDREMNGLIIVDDPQALIYLGYGFKDPKPGLWRVRLMSTASTPPGGADFALSARFVGGTELIAQIDPLLPSAGEPVRLVAHLRLGNHDLALRSAVASIHRPNGPTDILTLEVGDSTAEANVPTGPAGLYGVDLLVTGETPDGFAIERSAFLAFEVQPSGKATGLPPVAIWASLGLAVGAGGLLLLRLRRRRSQTASA